MDAHRRLFRLAVVTSLLAEARGAEGGLLLLLLFLSAASAHY